MKDEIIEIKFQTCNIASAMLRNLNDNFKSISFDLISNGDIIMKIVLEKRTNLENESIEDIVAEFAALQKSNRVNKAQVEVGSHHLPLRNLVYNKTD